jgi:hypothetical protein
MQGRPREPGETVFACLMLLLGVFVMAEGWRLDAFHSPSSAGIFPVFAGLVMAVSAAAVILRTCRMVPPPAAAEQGLLRAFLRRVTPKEVAAMAALMVAYMLALEPFGFLAASFAFLLVSILYLHRRGLVFAAVVSAATLALIWVVFRLVFTVVLPAGRLFG